jgi:hypothetical protein
VTVDSAFRLQNDRGRSEKTANGACTNVNNLLVNEAGPSNGEADPPTAFRDSRQKQCRAPIRSFAQSDGFEAHIESRRHDS